MTLDAKAVVEALQSGDGNRILPYVWEEEIKANGYTAASLTAICREALNPVLIRNTARGPELQDDGGSAAAGLQLSSPEGRPGELAVSVFKTSNGPRFSFMNTLMAAWAVDYRLRKGEPRSLETLATGQIEGWEKYGSTLRGLGCKVIAREQAKEGVLELEGIDEYVHRWRGLLADSKEGG